MLPPTNPTAAYMACSLEVRDGERAAQQYDAMASRYAVENEDGPFNAHYERPATISFIGPVVGRRILEIGCGSGPLTQWLATTAPR